MICASNMNRSMEAHSLFLKKGFKNLASFGTNGRVKLPGPAADKPIVYDFGTPYTQIAEDLRQQDEELYTQKGLLYMLDRNCKVKKAPQRFQETQEEFDLLIAFEERVFDIVCEVLAERRSVSGGTVHILNLNVPDNRESAVLGAIDAFNLVKMLDDADDEWEDALDDTIDEFEKQRGTQVLHAVAFY